MSIISPWRHGKGPSDPGAGVRTAWPSSRGLDNNLPDLPFGPFEVPDPLEAGASGEDLGMLTYKELCLQSGSRIF